MDYDLFESTIRRQNAKIHALGKRISSLETENFQMKRVLAHLEGRAFATLVHEAEEADVLQDATEGRR